MGNLILANPSEPPETLKAIITAVFEDEAILASQGDAIAALEAGALSIAVNGTPVAAVGSA